MGFIYVTGVWPFDFGIYKMHTTLYESILTELSMFTIDYNPAALLPDL